jgi:hypothetical protein
VASAQLLLDALGRAQRQRGVVKGVVAYGVARVQDLPRERRLKLDPLADLEEGGTRTVAFE